MKATEQLNYPGKYYWHAKENNTISENSILIVCPEIYGMSKSVLKANNPKILLYLIIQESIIGLCMLQKIICNMYFGSCTSTISLIPILSLSLGKDLTSLRNLLIKMNLQQMNRQSLKEREGSSTSSAQSHFASTRELSSVNSSRNSTNHLP